MGDNTMDLDRSVPHTPPSEQLMRLLKAEQPSLNFEALGVEYTDGYSS